MRKVSQEQLLSSYGRVMEFKIRRMMIENEGREETDEEAEERIDATCEHELLELHFIAGFVQIH